MPPASETLSFAGCFLPVFVSFAVELREILAVTTYGIYENPRWDTVLLHRFWRTKLIPYIE